MEARIPLHSGNRAAVVAAFAVILYGFVSEIVFLNYLWGIVSAAAFIFLASNFRLRLGLGVGAIATVMILRSGGVAQAATFVLSIYVPGIVIGFLAGRGRGGFRAVFWGLLPALLLVGLLMTAYADISVSLSLTIERWIDSFALQASEMGQSQELVERMTSELKAFGEVLVELLPAFMLFSVLFNLTLAYLVSHKVGAKLDSQAQGLPPFSRWRVSDHFLGAVLFGAVFSLLHLPALTVVGHNLLAFCAGLYGFAGLALAEFFLVKLNVPRLVKLLVYLLIFLGQMISLTLLGLIGLFDSRLDFRKLKGGAAVSA